MTINSFRSLFQHPEETLKQIPIPDDLIAFLDDYRAKHPETWNPKLPNYVVAKDVYASKTKQLSPPASPKSPKKLKQEVIIDLSKQEETGPLEELATKEFHDLTSADKKKFVETKFTFPFQTGSSSKEKTESCDTFMIKWSENSCWLDSVLMLYFTVAQPFFMKYFVIKKMYTRPKGRQSEPVCNVDRDKDLYIRNSLKSKLTSFFNKLNEDKKTRQVCVDFRIAFSECDALANIQIKEDTHMNSGIGSADAIEFNELLLSLFEVNLNALQQNQSKDPKKPLLLTSRDSPVIRIPLPASQTDQESIKSFEDMISLTYGDSSADKFIVNHPRAIVIQSIKSEIMFVHYLSPLRPTTMKKLCPKSINWQQVYKPFNPELMINVDGNSSPQYRLIGIVIGQIKTPRHFTLMIRCKNSWFLFDDTHHEIAKIGTYEKVIEHLGKSQGVFIAAYSQS